MKIPKVEEKLYGSSITVYPASGYKYYAIRASVSPMSSFSSDFALSISVNAVKNGTDGNPGNPGSNGISYWLAPSVTQIVCNSIGNVEPSSFTVYCKKSEAGEIADYPGMYLSVWRSNDGSNWSQVGSAVKASSVVVTPSASYNQYVIRAGSVAIPSWGSSYALSESVNMVKDGTNGTAGSTGSMPRLCGAFTSGQSYVWNSEFRDIVYKTVDGINQLFMVGTFGRTVTAAPYSSTQNDADWVASSKWQFVATDTLLAEGANIAGFMYKAMKMVSQAMVGGVPNLSLDGISGNVSIAGDGRLVIGDKGRTAYFDFNAQTNQIRLYNAAGENLMSFGIISGLSWIELKSGNYTLNMYGSSITLSYGSRQVLLSPNSCSITDGTNEATIQSSIVRVSQGSSYTMINNNGVTSRNAAGDIALLKATELFFTKTGNSYS